MAEAHHLSDSPELPKQKRLLISAIACGIVAFGTSLPFVLNTNSPRSGGSVLHAAASDSEMLNLLDRAYSRGIPFSVASDLRLTSPDLVGILNDPYAESAGFRLANTIIAAGINGTDDMVTPLRKFLAGGEGALSHPVYLAKTNVPIALGYIYRNTKSKAAGDALLSGLSPEAWARIRWRSEYHHALQTSRFEMLLRHIQALGIAGIPAQKHGLKLPETSKEEKQMIYEALAEAKAVDIDIHRAGSLKAYFAE